MMGLEKEVFAWIVEQAGGAQYNLVNLRMLLAARQDLTESGLQQISDFLQGEGVIEQKDDSGLLVWLIHSGVKREESQPDLSVDQEERSTPPPAPIVNNTYHGPVGSVQQGGQNSANIVQNSRLDRLPESENSTGHKWWLKFVVIPLAVAVIAGVFAHISKSPESGNRAPLPQVQPSATPKPHAGEASYSESGFSERIRMRTGLRPLTVPESGRLSSQLPSGVYGFSHPQIFEGLDRELDRVPRYGRLSFETHKLSNGTVVAVVFVNLDTHATLSQSPTVSQQLTLYSDYWDEAKFAALVIPGSCNGKSRAVDLDGGSHVNLVDCNPAPR